MPRPRGAWGASRPAILSGLAQGRQGTGEPDVMVGEGGRRRWGSRSEGARHGQCVRVRVRACACVCACACAWARLLSEAPVGPQAAQVALTSVIPVA